MSHRKTLSAILLLSATLFGACDDSPTSPPSVPWPGPIESGSTPGLLMTDGPSVAAALAQPDRRDAAHNALGSADVVTFWDPGLVVGVSRMRRGPAHVNVQLEAGSLAPGTTTTLWAVVFNNAAACEGECDDPDLFDNPAAQADLLYVAGSTADGQGRVRYSGRIGQGDLGSSIMPLFGLPAFGVLDARSAEIHLVVRSHGPGIPTLRRAQLSTFNGGCGGMGGEFGAPGPNTCEDLYFASHYAAGP